MKWTSMTRYFIILILVFFISMYMIHDFKNKYQVVFGFDSKEDF